MCTGDRRCADICRTSPRCSRSLHNGDIRGAHAYESACERARRDLLYRSSDWGPPEDQNVPKDAERVRCRSVNVVSSRLLMQVSCHPGVG